VDYRGPRDEVGELASTFDDMLAAIERVTNAQRRFVADASHELRAPLTTIRGSLEFLRRAPDLPGEDRSAVLADAYAEAERMTALVNDLLLLARADASASSMPGSDAARLDDQLRGRREPVELDQMALDIFRHARAQLQARRERGIQLALENLEPEVVMGDPGQIRQVLLILLDNAIKYTPSGGKVRISVSRQGTRAAVSISDTGIGIEPEVRPHIFERFFRGDQARERDQHGSGLGLAIAKWIVDAHQGEISVRSQPGKGSTFTMLLPASKRIGEQTSTKQPALPARAPRPSRSVVADAISPLARWAGSVSRPRTLKAPRRKPARDGRGGSDTGKPAAAKSSHTKHQRPTVPPRSSAGHEE
jgi:signal transduction histidine kinase